MEKQTIETYLYTPSEKVNDPLDFYLCFPGPYHLGMSSLGFLHLFQLMDTLEYIKPQRLFSDSKTTKLLNNSIISFSFSFELDFLRIFKILQAHNIPVLKKYRTEEHPIIFAGGPVVSTNPEPFSDFFDFIVIGDGKEPLKQLSKLLYNNKTVDKKSKLNLLSKISGIYVPEFFDINYNEDNTIKSIVNINDNKSSTVKKAIDSCIDQCVYSPILTSDTVFSDTLLIEVERGCSQKCHFCIASYLNLPVRYPSTSSIIEILDRGLKHTRKIGLLGALITEHPDIEEIFEHIYKLHKVDPIKLTTSSLRADKLNAKIAHILSECDQKQITISIEAGSERLRKALNKKLTNEDILNCIDICVSNNINTIKLYAMVGLPDEHESDIIDLIELVKSIKSINKHGEIILSVNSFIPKAHTPFERIEIKPYAYNTKHFTRIKKELLKTAKVRSSSIKWDRVQAIISRGDRRLGEVLLKAFEHGGTLGSFNRAFKDNKYYCPDPDWLALRKRSPLELLPWQHIEF